MDINIYNYIRTQEAKYQKPIDLEDGWSWSMKEHLRLSFLQLNSQFSEDNDDRTLRPNKNIVLGIMNVAFRTLDFDVKDIELFVDGADGYYKSFLSKKYHEKWALDNEMDTFIDDTIYSYQTYGGVMTKNIGKKRPIVVNLRNLAFCSQRDILSYPFGIKHTLSIKEIRDMEQWGTDANGADIDKETFISMILKEDKDEAELYEVVGNPQYWGQEDGELEVNIVSYYKNQENQEIGVTLYKKRLPKLNYKFLKRDKVENRALGRGGVEELFQSQIWTNWNEIKLAEMMESASKTIMLTDDKQLLAKHPTGLKGLDNLSIVETTSEGKGLWQADTFPRNLEKFNNDVDRWLSHAQTLGSAADSLLGEEPNSGTPFALFQAQQIEGKSMHKYRQGQLAVFFDEMYRDWILPHIRTEIVNDISFLSELSADEMMEIAESISENVSNRERNERVLKGEVLLPGENEQRKADILEGVLKGGSNKFINILKKDFSSEKLSVRTNIVGKQKKLALLTDKMVSFVRQILATPQIRQDPEMIKWTNTILESSGISPMMFSATPMLQEAQGGSTEALKGVSEQNAGNLPGQA